MDPLALTYQLFKDLRQHRSDAAEEKDAVDRYARALIVELRVALNLLDLAVRAAEDENFECCTSIIQHVSCPLLSAVGMGLNEVTLTSTAAASLLAAFDDSDSRGGHASETANAIDKSRSIQDNISLIVARLRTVQAIATVESPGLRIDWPQRLKRLRAELLTLLRALLEHYSSRTQ